MKTGFFLLLFSIQFSIIASAQSNPDFEDLYLKNIPLFQDIVSGGYYVDPKKEIEGHPYFISRNFENGSLTINGLTYQNVPLSYNIFSDELITFQPVHKQKILIRSDKINSFKLALNGIQHFVLLPENPGYTYHRNGIYELSASGEANLLIKHYKQTKAKKDISIYTSEFYEKSDYLLQKDGEIRLIQKPKHAFNFLDLDKKDIKPRLKEKGLNFRFDPGAYLGFLTHFYNQQQNP